MNNSPGLLAQGIAAQESFSPEGGDTVRPFPIVSPPSGLRLTLRPISPA